MQAKLKIKPSLIQYTQKAIYAAKCKLLLYDYKSQAAKTQPVVGHKWKLQYFSKIKNEEAYFQVVENYLCVSWAWRVMDFPQPIEDYSI